MKNFKDYMSLAINRQGLKSNNALARELEINNAAMSALYRGKSLPSEDTMVKLAELAGMPKEEALIDLNLWRSASQPEIQTVWSRIAKMIRCAILAAFLAVNPTQAKTIKNNHLEKNVKNFEVYSIYIMRQIFKLFLRFKRYILTHFMRCCHV